MNSSFFHRHSVEMEIYSHAFLTQISWVIELNDDWSKKALMKTDCQIEFTTKASPVMSLSLPFSSVIRSSITLTWVYDDSPKSVVSMFPRSPTCLDSGISGSPWVFCKGLNIKFKSWKIVLRFVPQMGWNVPQNFYSHFPDPLSGVHEIHVALFSSQ